MLADRIGAALAVRNGAALESRNDVDMWLSNFLAPAMSQGYGLTTTYAHMRVTEIANTLPGYAVPRPAA